MDRSSTRTTCIKTFSLKKRLSKITAGKPDDGEILGLANKAFSGMCSRDIKRMLKFARKGKLKRYELLLKGGESNQTLYLITSGACLTRHSKSFFAEVDEGHFVGEISFLTGQAASVDVVARTQVEYLSWDRDRLEKLLKRSPRLRSRFYSMLGSHMANRLLCATEKLVAA